MAVAGIRPRTSGVIGAVSGTGSPALALDWTAATCPTALRGRSGWMPVKRRGRGSRRVEVKRPPSHTHRRSVSARPIGLPTPQEPTINDEVQLIGDGDGLAVIGEPAVVDRFLASEGLVATRDFGLPTARGVTSTGAAAAEAGAGLGANSGR